MPVLFMLIAIPALVINWLYLLIKFIRAPKDQIVRISPNGPPLTWTILLVGWPVIIAVVVGVLLAMLDSSGGSYVPGIIIGGSIFIGLCALGIVALVNRRKRAE